MINVCLPAKLPSKKKKDAEKTCEFLLWQRNHMKKDNQNEDDVIITVLPNGNSRS